MHFMKNYNSKKTCLFCETPNLILYIFKVNKSVGRLSYDIKDVNVSKEIVLISAVNPEKMFSHYFAIIFIAD